MAYIMEPPKPPYLTETSSLRSFRSSIVPSVETGSLKAARSFTFMRGTRKNINIATGVNVVSKVPIRPSAGTSENTASTKGRLRLLVDAPSASRTPKKSLLQKITNTFRKAPKSSLPVPPLPAASAKPQRDDSSTLARELNQQEQFSGLRDVSEVGDFTAAIQIKQEWEEKNRAAEAEQRERLANFKFGGKAVASSSCSTSFVGPVALKVSEEADSLICSRRKKAPTALKLDRGRLGPSGPPPDRALPPSPSDPDYQAYLSQLPPSPSRREQFGTIDPNSLSPPSRFPISTASDESSSIATPSLGSSIFDWNGPFSPFPGYESFDIFKRDKDGDPSSPLRSFQRSMNNQKPSYASSLATPLESQNTPSPTRGGVNPTMHTLGTISRAAAAIEDDESRRLTELAFLS